MTRRHRIYYFKRENKLIDFYENIKIDFCIQINKDTFCYKTYNIRENLLYSQI